MNGESVGVGPAREFNNARKEDGSKYTQAFYNTYDITDNIKNGDNVISAVAYNRDTNNRAFLAQATVFYKDGTKEVLTNSATCLLYTSWKTCLCIKFRWVSRTVSVFSSRPYGTGF